MPTSYHTPACFSRFARLTRRSTSSPPTTMAKCGNLASIFGFHLPVQHNC
ncbi:hypothetical protein BVRB_4g097510 [Beta vulgaris subsp. vulgaris]|uniref:Uncharacterized protein n=1 Tax=Beta vulgaris subsp. vulgaris TaxID=3555 RepID=A0A0J8E461_BETVV|nr:hypothetical protein BVRB_4g097510 [Beta vulgaris subsp. vulgaris]